MPPTKTTARKAFLGQRGSARSHAFCADLRTRGPLGGIAEQLFWIQRVSQNAAQLSGSLAALAYESMDAQIEALCQGLKANACGMAWGWGIDDHPSAERQHVLYVDLPVGQVSFSSSTRYVGPTFTGQRDEAQNRQERLIEFCQRMFDAGRKPGSNGAK